MFRGIVLDTNVLMALINYGLDPIEALLSSNIDIPIKIIALEDITIRELEKILDNENFNRILDYLRRNKVKIVNSGIKIKDNDRRLLEFCYRNRFALFTLDKVLIKKAKKKGVMVITLRNNRAIIA